MQTFNALKFMQDINPNCFTGILMIPIKGSVEKKKEREREFLCFGLPEYVFKQNLKAPHLLISLFEREIFTKIVYLNFAQIKTRKFKFSLEGLDKKILNEDIEHLHSFESFLKS